MDGNLFDGLTQLLWLDLSANQLSTLPENLFARQSRLKYLDLPANQLGTLPENLFDGLTELTRLDLSANQLGTLLENLFDGLTELTRLDLSANQLGTVDENLFAGLTALESLDLSANQLGSLPDGLFSGLTSLTGLQVSRNTTAPLPITVSLELDGVGQFKAKAHTGAPFEMILPLEVTNGDIDGASSIEIPQGSIESDALTVSRTTGTTAPITIDIETLPTLPSEHEGYAFVRSADRPIEVIGGLPEVTIYPTTLSVPVGGSNTYTVDLKSLPTMDVTVSVKVPQNSDVSVNPTELIFAVDTYDMSQGVTVTADAGATTGVVTLQHMISGGNYQDVPVSDVTVTIIQPTVANQPPVFTSGSSFEVMENEVAVGRVVATDADARDYITGYEITGGADRAQFAIKSYDIPGISGQTRSANAGELTFVTVPDYEQPADAAGTNEYVVVVTATSGTGTREQTIEQTITVTVTDKLEPPGRPLAPTLTFDTVPISRIIVSPGPIPPANTGPIIHSWEMEYTVKNSGVVRTYFPPFILAYEVPAWTVGITVHRNTTYEVRVRAKNDDGWSEWSPWAEATIPNASPIASGSIDDLTMPAGGAVVVVSVDDAFDDPDDTRLRYTATSSNSTIATLRMIDTEVLIDPLTSGTTTITVTATDPWGATASTTFDANIQTPTLSAPTLSISGNVFSFGFTDDFAANETRFYEVKIRHKSPIGPWATACINATNTADFPRNIATSLDILASSFFEPGTTYEADYGYLGADCGDSVISVRSAPAEATTAGTPSFDIDLVFVGSISSNYQLAVENAARRWEQIITHDVPNHPLSDDARSLLNEHYPGMVPDKVDDLLIYVEIAPIDGVGGTLGQAGSDVWRVPSALPIASHIELDADDLDGLSDERLTALMLHEIGHTLGFGVEPWTDHNLLQNPSLNANHRRIIPAPDTHFSGANAIAAFNAAGGTSYADAKVPVENTRGGSGSQDSHWRESVLDNELMTPRLESLADNPLSAITIQSLADIGYRVDATQADAYMVPDASLRVARDSLPINCAIITHPDAGPDKPEPIVLEVESVVESHRPTSK